MEEEEEEKKERKKVTKQKKKKRRKELLFFSLLFSFVFLSSFPIISFRFEKKRQLQFLGVEIVKPYAVRCNVMVMT